MALFVFWGEQGAGPGAAEQLDACLPGESHIVPEQPSRGSVDTPAGRWHFMAFATTTHFYSAERQVWQADGKGVCVIHGLIWRIAADGPRLLDAADVAALLDRPDAAWPDDISGEYAVARLHADGTLIAFSDRAGLHQLFHGSAGSYVAASRAALVAAVTGDRTPNPDGLSWLPAMGYRAGTATAYRAVTQLAQGHVLTIGPDHQTIRPASSPVIGFSADRGYSPALDAVLDKGIVQARAAIRLGVGADGPIDLPITGGKDSRVILALCLAEGLRDRLRLFTRGYAGHPDVIAGQGIAEALGLPHRREPPHGSDEPAYWSRAHFFGKLMAQTWQTDGMVGGWDLILGERVAAETLITGHMGEVLKAYSKRPLPEGILDPVAMVRLQAPFDPMGLLLPEARERLCEQLGDQMELARRDGAGEADLPDIFYYRNRIPNWLGAIRAIKSFERQPVVPLGAPALLGLAFRLTAEERKAELLHYKIVERCAPDLLGLPFAMQRWDARLPGAPQTDPVLPGADAPPVFGNWQFSLNHNAAIRAALAAEVEARPDLTLWRSIDRAVLLDRLRNRRLDYFDGISMLGLVVAMFQESGLVQPTKIGGTGDAVPAGAACADYPRPAITGHLDAIRAAGDALIFDGWAHARDFPAAQVAVEARLDGVSLGIVAADGERPDLIPHGMGDGRHGFSLGIPRDRLRAAAGGAARVQVAIAPFDSDHVMATPEIAL
ncbi:hypothetical protein ASE00_15120 [Sphingomonas sp. Root710]|uniref:hypothetical protein n=1 Tax=Sphingomonas sp. Root710 TaxID=1736594 RepID=UPI0006F2AA60|nr:hypothetical protein [Sphingomonas sp. Root710]KRB81320.1 hypothetical protein ASE00_15120 [Sphingomonas sp. Root710]